MTALVGAAAVAPTASAHVCVESPMQPGSCNGHVCPEDDEFDFHMDAEEQAFCFNA